MANVKFKIGLKANLPKTGIVEGTWYLAKDAGELYYGDASNQMVLVDASNNLKNITITAGSGLQGGGSISSTGTSTTISHKTVDTTESGSGDFVADIQFDEFGHVTSITRTNIALSDLGVTASAAELNYVKGVTSSIQTQLNSKASSSAIPAAATVAPKVDGTAAVGTSAKYAREDHIHPTDTTRAASSVSISAGTGLTGGGTLAASRTISHQAKPEEGEDAGGTGSFVTGVTIDELGHVVSTTKGNAPSLTGGAAATSGQYVSGVTVSGHAVTVTKAALPTTISGNAGSATKLSTARKISLGGDVSGSASFDGSADVTITATVEDDSHNHTIANVDNLQVELDDKAPLVSPHFLGAPTAPTAAASANNTQVATTAFVKTAVNSAISGLDGAMVFKGTIGSTGATVTALPDSHTAGWTYVVATAGTYAGETCEVGDMITCVKTGTAAANADWNVVQNNINGAVTGPASAVDSQVAVFNGSTGKIIKAVNASALSVGSASTATSATTATNLASNPSLAASGNNITVTAGGKKSAEFTVPYATSAGSASTASNATNSSHSSDLNVREETVTGSISSLLHAVAIQPNTSSQLVKLYVKNSNNELIDTISVGNASKVANALTLKVNTGTTEGTNLYTFNGSAAKTLDIKAGSNVTLTAASGALTIAATDTKYNAATSSAAGLMSAADKSKLDGISDSADSVAFTRSLTSGTKVGTITINGTGTDIYCQTNTDTKYSAGSNGGLTLSGTAFSLDAPASTTVTNTTGTTATTLVSTGTGVANRNYAIYRTTTGEPYVTVPWTDTNTNTTYTFAGGTDGFSVTPSGGSAQKVSVDVSVTNSAPTLAWGTTSTIGTVSGTALTVKMPSNPNTHYTAKLITTNSPTSTTIPTEAVSNPYLNVIENGSISSSIRLMGVNRTTVSSLSNGTVQINTPSYSAGTGLSINELIISHSTAAGYQHIPAGGASGQFLGYSSAGTAKWVSAPTSNVTFADGYNTSFSGSSVIISGDGVVDASLDSASKTYQLTWARPSYIQGYAKTITVNGTSFTVNASDSNAVSITTGGMSYSSYTYTSTSLTIAGGTCRYPSSYSSYSSTLTVSLTGFSSSKSDAILVVYGTRTVSFSSNSNLIKMSDIPTTGSSSSTYRIYAFQYLGGKIAVNCAEYTA
jgi:hypothetical protein